MSASTAVIKLGMDNFRQEVLENPNPILIDFWAPWCAPCRMMKPAFEGAAEELAGSVRSAAVNVDEEPTLSEAFGIRGIPTLALLRGKEVLGAFSGLATRDQVVTWVNEKVAQEGHDRS